MRMTIAGNISCQNRLQGSAADMAKVNQLHSTATVSYPLDAPVDQLYHPSKSNSIRTENCVNKINETCMVGDIASSLPKLDICKHPHTPVNKQTPHTKNSL